MLTDSTDFNSLNTLPFQIDPQLRCILTECYRAIEKVEAPDLSGENLKKEVADFLLRKNQKKSSEANPQKFRSRKQPKPQKKESQAGDVDLTESQKIMMKNSAAKPFELGEPNQDSLSKTRTFREEKTNPLKGDRFLTI